MPHLRRPLTILVVEDNVGDFVLFEAYLQMANINVKKLNHAKALSEVFVAEDEDKIDIAFLDLSLPDASGIESFTRLNDRFPDVPIVVLSGLADETTALQCITLGAQDYLLKNALNEQLLQKSISYSIERKKNLREILAINKQYELIGDVTEDVIWTWDIQSQTITYGKKSFFGYSNGEILNTPDWFLDKIHPEDKDKVAHVISDIVEKRLVNAQVEFRFRSSEGTYEYVYSRGALLPCQNGDPRQMVGAMMNITERKRLQDELIKAQLNFHQQMTEAVLLGQEKQKEELGKELHDNINQILASVKLFLETAKGNETLKDELLEMSTQNIAYAIDEIRKLSHSLIPPSLGSTGLVDAVTDLINELNTSGLFQTNFFVDNFDETLLDNTKKLMLYRVFQEQMNNIVKYARAKEVNVKLSMSNSILYFSISDDGIGFDIESKSKGIGLKNIESRIAYSSGKAQLLSSPGKGTSLDISMPI